MISRNGYQRLARDCRLDARKATHEIKTALSEGQIRPDEFSIRALAEHLVEDGREWVASMDPGYGNGTFVESAGSVSTVNFSNITGQIVYSTVLDAYMDSAFVFSGLVKTVPTKLSGEKIPGVQRIGDQAAIVGEGAPYPLVGVGEDWINTPPTVKRGMICPVTKEAVFFDRTNLVLQRSGEVGHFLGVNKEKRIIDCIVDENTTAGRYQWKGTTYATYAASGGHGVVNQKGTNALIDWTSIDAALLVGSAIVDPWTGEPIMFTGNDLIVTPQMVTTAYRILTATNVRVATGGYPTSGSNPTLQDSPLPLGISGYSAPGYNIRTSNLLPARMTTDTSWFIGDINKSFAYMENWPLTVEQAAAGSTKEFEQDIVAQFKASERGAAATLDVRHMVKNLVA